jgi:hypothetical protein
LNVGSEHSLVDWLLGLGGIAATFAAVFVAFYLNRRSELEKTVQEHGEDIAHIEGHLEATGDYTPHR